MPRVLWLLWSQYFFSAILLLLLASQAMQWPSWGLLHMGNPREESNELRHRLLSKVVSPQFCFLNIWCTVELVIHGSSLQCNERTIDQEMKWKKGQGAGESFPLSHLFNMIGCMQLYRFLCCCTNVLGDRVRELLKLFSYILFADVIGCM